MRDFNLLVSLITGIVVLGIVLSTCGFLTFVERKVAGYVQDRIGPNRVGPFGLLQALADGLKFLFKEDVIPDHVDKPLYVLAPALAAFTGVFAFVVVAFGYTTPPPQPPAPLAV